MLCTLKRTILFSHDQRVCTKVYIYPSFFVWILELKKTGFGVLNHYIISFLYFAWVQPLNVAERSQLERPVRSRSWRVFSSNSKRNNFPVVGEVLAFITANCDPEPTQYSPNGPLEFGNNRDTHTAKDTPPNNNKILWFETTKQQPAQIRAHWLFAIQIFQQCLIQVWHPFPSRRARFE